MSAFTPASEVILRHTDEFLTRRVLFAGDLQDSFPGQLVAASVSAHTSQYHHWQQLSRTLGAQAHFSLIAEADTVAHCDTLIYYWPKSKQEAQFQLTNLLSLMPVGSELFVVGENRSGVRSAESLLTEYCPLSKIDSARRCGLYHGRLEQQPSFDPDAWWSHYPVADITVKTLPGVFSRGALDNGSELLLSTFTEAPSGKVLDIGCGAGVLAAVLGKQFPALTLTLSDVNAAAIAASRATLAANSLIGEVIISNVYSDIQGKFDLIVSNPPFHEGLQTSLHAAETLIRGAASHLLPGGRLRIVANAFLPYPALLDAVFGQHQVLAQTGRFKVYQATLSHPGRKAAKSGRKR